MNYNTIELIFKTGDQIKARAELERQEDFNTTLEYVAKELERIHKVLINQKVEEPKEE